MRRPQVTQAVSEAAALGDRSENAEYIYGKKMLREIDSRVRFLRKRLENLKVVGERPADPNRVYFGAWVTLEDEDGEQACYRIVGPDELDLRNNQISIDSPLARALVGRGWTPRCWCTPAGEKACSSSRSSIRRRPEGSRLSAGYGGDHSAGDPDQLPDHPSRSSARGLPDHGEVERVAGEARQVLAVLGELDKEGTRTVPALRPAFEVTWTSGWWAAEENLGFRRTRPVVMGARRNCVLGQVMTSCLRLFGPAGQR